MTDTGQRVESTWQACPVCAGVGSLPNGFYGMAVATSTAREICRTCHGFAMVQTPTDHNAVATLRGQLAAAKAMAAVRLMSLEQSYDAMARIEAERDKMAEQLAVAQRIADWQSTVTQHTLSRIESVTHERDKLAEQLAAWHEAMTDVSVINWTLSQDNAENLHMQLMDVIANAVQMELDPTVSKLAEQKRLAVEALESYADGAPYPPLSVAGKALAAITALDGGGLDATS